MTRQLFFIHGMWAGPWCWDDFAAYFSERGYDCQVTTLRHHDVDPTGPIPPALGATSLLDYAEDLAAEVSRFEGKPVLVGHSMGGLLAQVLASRGLAKATVLLTPGAPAGILALRPSVIRSFWSIHRRWGFWRKPMRQTFPEAVYSMLHLLPTVQQPSVYGRFVHESGRAATEIGYWFCDPRHASRVDASKVTCPMLVVGGGQDRITPASIVRRIAAKYEHVSTYQEFPEHAHWILADPGWKEVAGFVDAWLKRSLPVW